MFPWIFPIIIDEEECEKACWINCIAIRPGARKVIKENPKIAEWWKNAEEKYKNEKKWNLTFSYGRALQEDALTAWSSYKRENDAVSRSQDALMRRAKMNSEASIGNLIFN